MIVVDTNVIGYLYLSSERSDQYVVVPYATFLPGYIALYLYAFKLPSKTTSKRELVEYAKTKLKG
ncbi:MAG: hypothetical protein HY673_12375 [Chloroflexi bacterium]|nr:hypothetical protein [Chloroflexota bacterium]